MSSFPYPYSYSRAVNSSNLRDSERHHTCEPLAASGWAAKDLTALGAILIRIKYADGTPSGIFDPGCRNYGDALRIWLPMVRSKGEHRGWYKGNSTPKQNARAARALYVRVGESSLAYFLDRRCMHCEGTGVDSDRRTCHHCKGSKIGELRMREPDRGIALDLVAELESIELTHSSRAAHAMRQVDLDAVIANARQARK